MTLPAADYSSFGKLKVSGADRISVLHNILTQDIKNIPAGGHSPAALLTHTGKILLYMEVFHFENFLLLVLENQSASKAIPLIDKFIITEDVSLEDVTESYSFFQVFTPKPEYFLCSRNEVDTFIQQKGFQIVSDCEAETLRIEAGIPRYGIDMDENTILSETGLDAVAVSRTKGCYPGQEVIARIETYKGLTKKLTRFVFEGTGVQAGDKIYTEGKEDSIGWITSAAVISSGKSTVLGYLLKNYFDQDLNVKILTADGKTIRGKSGKLAF